MSIQYKIAETSDEFKHGEKLFLLYAGSLNVDLSFQNFTDELKTINKQYNKPGGALLIAYNGEDAIGCAGLRMINSEVAELKRMFVLTEYNGQGIGKKMLGIIIDIARKLKYKKIKSTYKLRAPITIFGAIIYPGLRIKLIPLNNRIPRVQNKLGRPFIVSTQAFYGPKVIFAASKRGK